METWPPSVLWEGVEERLSPALEVECVTVSWGFTSLEFESAGREQGITHDFKHRLMGNVVLLKTAVKSS